MGLPEETNRKLLKFIKIGGSNDEILAALEALAIENENYQNGLSELKTVISQAASLGINPANIQIDLSITRGLDYYTGTVYETFFDAYPEFGSVCSGGRYENLSSVFMDKKFPGVGISIGLTRLFDQLRSHNLLKIKGPTPNRALIIMQSEDYKDNALKLAGCLRKADIPADVYLRNVKFKKKMEYANKIQIPYLIIIGEDEAAAGDYTLKNMATGEQKRLSLEQVAAEIKADA